MNFKDRFDRITAEIERLVDCDDKYGNLKANEIIDILRRQEGKSARELTLIFEYISGKSLSRYVKDRKMMATYRLMLRDDEYEVQWYVDYAGYDNESSFSTAFSEKFGMPPKKAYQEKDKTKIEDPISIDSIISGADSPDESTSTTEKIFGLPKDVIDKYNDICEYQALYGLEDKYAELAVYLTREKGLPIQEAFNTVENLVTDYKDDISAKDSLNKLLDYINEEVPVVYVKHQYPELCLPELCSWYLFMKDEGINLLEETPEFVRAYFDNMSDGFSYKDLKEFYKDYLENYANHYTFMECLEAIQIHGSLEALDWF